MRSFFFENLDTSSYHLSNCNGKKGDVMEEGDVEGGKSDGDGDKGGRATKRVRAAKRATKTKRKK